MEVLCCRALLGRASEVTGATGCVCSRDSQWQQSVPTSGFQDDCGGLQLPPQPLQELPCHLRTLTCIEKKKFPWRFCRPPLTLSNNGVLFLLRAQVSGGAPLPSEWCTDSPLLARYPTRAVSTQPLQPSQCQNQPKGLRLWCTQWWYQCSLQLPLLYSSQIGCCTLL